MIKTSSKGYVKIKSIFHFGEIAFPTGKKRTAEDGEIEAEMYLIFCIHGGERTIWIRRSDI